MLPPSIERFFVLLQHVIASVWGTAVGAFLYVRSARWPSTFSRGSNSSAWSRFWVDELRVGR